MAIHAIKSSILDVQIIGWPGITKTSQIICIIHIFITAVKDNFRPPRMKSRQILGEADVSCLIFGRFRNCFEIGEAFRVECGMM